MKQILSGWLRHAISSGGALLAFQQYQAGNKSGAVTGAIVSLIGFIQSALHKSEAAQPAPGPTIPVAKVALAVLFLALFTGCARVPATRISLDPKSNGLVIESPKDIALTNVVLNIFPATATNSARFELTIGSYTSKNNLEVIRAITDANAASLKAAVENGGALLGEVLSHAK